MVGRTAAQGRIPALKRTVFTSHGENPRRIGRIRREPALSGAFRAERTPHFARSFLPSPECRQNVETGWRREGDLDFQYPSFDRVQTGGKEQGPNSFESGPCSRDLELLPALSLSRPCGRAIALAETFPASAITPLDKTWSKVFAAAIATDQLARLWLATHLIS
jgi:hypothetical protein